VAHGENEFDTPDLHPKKHGVPDDGVLLAVCNVGVVSEQDGVVGHHRITGRQDASSHMAHAVQHAVIHQEVIHQQLFTQRGGPVAALVKNKEIAHLTADGEAYPKLLHSPLWRLGVVPQFDHRHLHRPIEDDVHAVHLRGNNRYAHTDVMERSPPGAVAELTLSQILTSPGSIGANHMHLPSWVLLTPSINLSGVLTSPLTLSRTFTLSGKAAMSDRCRAEEVLYSGLWRRVQ